MALLFVAICQGFAVVCLSWAAVLQGVNVQVVLDRCRTTFNLSQVDAG